MAASTKILVHNGAIYCSGQPDLSWMVFNQDSGYIEKVGRGVPPEYLKTEVATSVDCQDKRVLPGLNDAHVHFLSIGVALEGVQLRGSDSIEEFQRRVREHIKEHPERKWYWGRHWEQDLMGRYPTKEDLDAVCADKPVYMARHCGHIAVVNSKALELAGITRDKQDPEGGQIDRYPAGHPKAGEPTGVLREAPVLRFVSEFYGPSTKEDRLQCLRTATDYCLSKGVTTVQALDPTSWPLYCELVDKDELKIRTFFVDYLAGSDRAKLPAPGATYGKLLSTDRLKLFSDGSLGGSTAALSKPYKGTENRGIYIHSQGELNSLVAEGTAMGYRLEIHAIGDAAADATLAALKIAGVAPEKRPIIVHCQILRPDVIEKMRTQGAIASIQPQFVPTDAKWAEECLPDNLLRWSYPWKTLLAEGVPCAGGSDAPVETSEPLIGMYDAIFRPHGQEKGKHQKAFRSEEALTVEQAIDLYTKGSAYAAMREHCLGQLLPGFLADFVILESPQDVVRHPECLLQAKPAQVWVHGQRRL